MKLSLDFLRHRTPEQLKRLYYRTRNALIKIPWRMIGIALGISLVIFWGLLQFYLAKPSRIMNGFKKNLAVSKQTSAELEETDKLARSLVKEQLPDFQNKMAATADNISKQQSSLPPRFFVWYTFLRSPKPLKEQIDRLYGQDKFDPEVIKVSAETVSEAARLSKELLDKGEAAIYSDTNGYISFLEQSTKILDNLDESNKVTLDIPRKIFSFIYLAAKDYQATGNKENFSERYSNLSSELAEETGLAWVNSTREHAGLINTRIHTLESILNKVGN